MIRLLIALLLMSLPANASDWTLDPLDSRLSFAYRQQGKLAIGQFSRFTAQIAFDPANPGAARIEVIVDLTSADAGAADRTAYLAEPPWFDSKTVSTARYAAKGVQTLGGNRYRADGTLRIKGIERPVTLDFTLDIKGDTAHAAGSATLVRLDWDIGGGQFASERFVGHTVTIDFDIKAGRTAP